MFWIGLCILGLLIGGIVLVWQVLGIIFSILGDILQEILDSLYNLFKK